jgi:ribonuclease P protein component
MQTDELGRLGITASRKVGGAVARNRAKRRIRELYRMQLPRRMTDCFDLVVNARSSCVLAPWEELLRDFDDCLARLARREKTKRP